MRYIALIYSQEMDPSAPPSEEEMQAIMEAYTAFTTEARESGAMLAGDALEASSTATCVRVEGGDKIVTDGPFAETKEQLGGFYIFDCKNLDEAIEWAAKIPGANHGTIEVRPIMEFD
jgi:hypothetical protein